MTLRALGSRLPDVTSASVGELSIEDLREKAVSWLDLGRDLRAREYAEALVERTPQDADAQLLAARVYARRPETQGEADRAHERASDLRTLTVEEYQFWVETLAGRRATTPARRVLKRLHADHGDDLRALLHVVRDYEALDDASTAWEIAISHLEDLPGDLTPSETTSWLETAWRSAPDGWQATTDQVEHLMGLPRLTSGCAPSCAGLLLRGGRAAQALEVLDVADEGDDPATIAGLRAEARIAFNEYFAAAELYDEFPPPDVTGRLNHLMSLEELGRTADARASLERLSQSLAGFPRPVSSPGLQSAIDQLELVRELYLMSLAEQEKNYDAQWTHVRRLSSMALLGYGEANPPIRAYLLRFRLLLARTWQQRDDVIAEFSDVVSSSQGEHSVVTNFVEAMLWASQVAPAGIDGASGAARAARRPLRQLADSAARAALVQHSYDDQRSERIKRARMAMLVGDRLLADNLISLACADDEDGADLPNPGGPNGRWQEALLRAWVAVECDRLDDALDLMTTVMGEWRQDLNARVVYAHLLRSSGDLEKATVEAWACAEAAPQNVPAQIMKAECLFDLAAASIARRSARARTAGKQEESTEAPSDAAESGGARGLHSDEASDNLQQLIEVVSVYRRVIELHNALARWLVDEDPEATPTNVGSELLTSDAFVEVCRQGLHAAALAGEGLTRLRLLADGQLEDDVEFLVDQLRLHERVDERHAERTRAVREFDAGRGRIRSMGHRRGTRDEAERLRRLFWAHRQARSRRWWRRGWYMLGGVALVVISQLAAQLVTLPGELVVAFGLAGLALVLVPLFPSVKLAGIELALGPDDEVATRRSDFLRSATVLRFEHQIVSGLPALPNTLSVNDGERALHSSAGRPSSQANADTVTGVEETGAPKDAKGTARDRLKTGVSVSRKP